MTDDSFLDSIDENNEINSNGNSDAVDKNIDIESIELADKKAEEQANKNLLARKRIDELKEEKRLRELFDDENDW